MRSAAVNQLFCRALAHLLRALGTVPRNPPTGCSPAWVPQKWHTEFDNAFCLSSCSMVALSATIGQATSELFGVGRGVGARSSAYDVGCRPGAKSGRSKALPMANHMTGKERHRLSSE